MASILEILKERQERRGQQVAEQGMASGIVVRRTGPRYVVNDGFHAITCDSMLADTLQEGDRVWIARGRGTTVIMGVAGRDKDFA